MEQMRKISLRPAVETVGRAFCFGTEKEVNFGKTVKSWYFLRIVFRYNNVVKKGNVNYYDEKKKWRNSSKDIPISCVPCRKDRQERFFMWVNGNMKFLLQRW